MRSCAIAEVAQNPEKTPVRIAVVASALRPIICPPPPPPRLYDTELGESRSEKVQHPGQSAKVLWSRVYVFDFIYEIYLCGLDGRAGRRHACRVDRIDGMYQLDRADPWRR